MVLPAGIRVGASTPVTADMTADSKVRPASSWDDEAPDSEPVPPWTAQQVQTLLAREKPFSPWRVVGLQAVVGGLLALAWWLWAPRRRSRCAPRSGVRLRWCCPMR